MLSLETHISELKTAAMSVLCVLLEVKAPELGTGRNPNKVQEKIAVSNSREKTLTEKALSLTEELTSLRMEFVKLWFRLNMLTTIE